MKNFENITSPLSWLMALLITALLAACGNGANDPILGGGGSGTYASSKAITAYSLSGVAGVISEGTTPKTISVIMPFGTDLTIPRVATYTTTGRSVAVVAAAQASGTTTNVFTQGTPKVYTVTAPDGTTASYNVNVTVALASAKALISYSLNGIAGVISEGTTPKTITVVMPTGTNLTLPLTATYLTTGTGVAIGGTAQTSGTTTNVFTQGTPTVYTVTAGNSTTANYNVNVSVAPNTAKAITSYSLDGIAGVISEATTPKTISVVMPFGTDLTIPRTATYVTTGTSVTVGTVTQVSGTTTNVFTQGTPKVYTVNPAVGTSAVYNVNVSVAPSPAKAITSFSLNGITGVISEATTPKTITVLMPFGTDLTLPLTATYLTTGTGVAITGTPQTSGITTNIFTQGTPTVYTVTAANASTAAYNVNVSVAPNTAKAITSYSLNGVAGTINETAKTISVHMATGTVKTSLTATFIITGTSATVGTAPVVTQVSGTTTNDFTNPVVYTVHASDASTVTYSVSVVLGPVLGTAAPFGIAATAGVTNTGTAPNTTINGDVVLDPVSGAICNNVAVDAAGGFGLCGGFAPVINGVVISPLFDLGITSSTIKADLLAAYNNLSSPPQALATSIAAGTTMGAPTGSALVLGDNWFTPGVYQSLTSIMITGDLTIDAQGNPDAIFIFQSSSTIGTAAGSAGGVPGTFTRILLVNGAKASNIWWQAGSAATLGLYSEFQGNILAHDSITMGTGATSCGRLLAGAFTAGAFVFDSNIVSVPGSPSAPATCQ